MTSTIMNSFLFRERYFSRIFILTVVEHVMLPNIFLYHFNQKFCIRKKLFSGIGNFNFFLEFSTVEFSFHILRIIRHSQIIIINFFYSVGLRLKTPKTDVFVL
jgi:hypothetical protein